MSLTNQFRALARLSTLFAGAWAVVGGLLGAFRGAELIGESAGSAMLSFAFMYGLVGAIAGIVTSLLIARAERNRPLRELHTGRVAAWGVLGGLAPPALLGTLGLLAGAPLVAILPLAGLGVVSGALGGVASASAVTAAKRAALRESDPVPRLPAT
jgi:hypothetical protein